MKKRILRKARYVLFVYMTVWSFSLCVYALEGTEYKILGSCTTVLSDDENRIKNIELALNKIDSSVIKTGGVFSFNRVVGNRTAARGFLPAPVLFQDKKSIQIGGGVCQVSSTLYNAVLLSDLKVVERYRHSSPISYLPLGLDATVAYGYRDMKFINTLPFPIRILTQIQEDTMTIAITAEKDLPYEVRLETLVREIESPFSEQLSQPGKEVLRYRIKTQSGRVIEREYLGKDYYHPVMEQNR